MFTGIIEATGLITDIKDIGGNRIFRVESPISHELKIDQSLSHNGVCLTVEDVQAGTHQVTAIAETLLKTNLGSWAPGTRVNLERCMAMNGRLDGHIVQGHVDDTATCVARREKAGSWEFSFRTNPRFAGLMIEKGSISLNGIIPYTFGHTNMKELQEGDTVNIEFDMIGKYVNRLATLRLS